MQLSVIRACARASVVGALLAVICACGGGGGSPNPVLGTLTFTTNENVALSATLTATDPGGTAVTFATTSTPASGTLAGLPGTGAFTYTPNANFTGKDSFGVTATDAAGNKSTGTVGITVTVDTAPTAGSAVFTSDGTDLGSVAVLKNVTDAEKDPLTVTIVDPPPAPATATVNNDGTVNLAGLSAFKGLTYFTFKATDPSGMATPTVGVYIFVGTPQFRAAFVGDAKGDGSNEVYLTDFAGGPVAMTAATQGNLRLAGFAIADNGATIAYRSQDTNSAGTTSLSFVQTSSPAKASPIPLPAGTVPILAGGKDQFIVSPDGQWIAVIAGQGTVDSLYVLNVSKPTVLSQIQPAGSTFATQPTFSLDSKSIYFLATGSADTLHRSLYFASLSSPGQTTLISKASNPASSDEISAYSVAPDQSRVLLQANRNGIVSIFMVATAHPTIESPISQALDFGQSIGTTTVGLLPYLGGDPVVSRVAYTVNGFSLTDPAGVYVADVSATPNPRLIVADRKTIGFRPDAKAVMYTQTSNNPTLVSEAGIDSVGTTTIGGGFSGWYDSTGNIVLLQQLAPSAALAATSRGNFGNTNPVGTSSLATWYTDVSGFQNGVAIIGQGQTASQPATATLQLVSALAPAGLLPLAIVSGQPPFASPINLTSYSSKIVSK